MLSTPPHQIWKHIIIFTLHLQVLPAQIHCPSKKIVLTDYEEYNASPYILVFEDNFDGTKLDTTKWKTSFGLTRNIESEQEWYTKKNIEISDGTLKIIAKRDTLINQCFFLGTQTYCQDFYFSAAEIVSREKFGHGKFEIRCKIPKGKGIGSAFWTYGDPGKNEIDVFEYGNEKDMFGRYAPDKISKVHRMNSHADYDYDGKKANCPSHYTGADISESFHTFTLVWTAHKLEWFVDGESKRVSTLFYSMHGQSVDCSELKTNHQYILNRSFPMNPMMIVAGLGIGTDTDAPDKTTPFPGVFEIDYIRFYRQVQ